MAKIKIKKSMLESPEKVRKFIDVFGADKYRFVLEELALKYGGTGTFGGFTQEQIALMTESDYEKHRDAILTDMSKIAPPDTDQEVTIEHEIHYTSDKNYRERFVDLMGHEIYMSAIGFDGLEDSSLVNLARLNPNIKPNTRAVAEEPKSNMN
jgi:hypothetical protein